MDLRIPQKTLTDRFKLEDFQHDFNVIKEEITNVSESLEHIKNYLTYEMFGANGDGIADDGDGYK